MVTLAKTTETSLKKAKLLNLPSSKKKKNRKIENEQQNYQEQKPQIK